MTNKKGFSLIKMILVCLLIAFCVFLVMLLIAKAKKTGCNDTNNSNSVFNNNMMYLQQVGTDFFTDDRLPSQLGETIKISLAELYEKKYALDITDKDGKSCSKEDSYVSVTKTERGYEMKTFLVCGTDSDYPVLQTVYLEISFKVGINSIEKAQTFSSGNYDLLKFKGNIEDLTFKTFYSLCLKQKQILKMLIK